MPARVRLLPVVLVALASVPAAWGGGSGTGIAALINGTVDIAAASRQNNSGAYAYFPEALPGARDFRLGTRDTHGCGDAVDRVEKPRAQRTTGNSS